MRSGVLLLATATLASPILLSDDGPTAAAKYNWTNIVQQDDFNGTEISDAWEVYDGPGQAGKGIRSPKALSLADGILTITGTPEGTTGGMGWKQGSLHGRWETRARFTAGTGAYHCVLLLWPINGPDGVDAGPGGEVDYTEIIDGTRQTWDFFLHYGKGGDQVNGEAKIDMTTWRNYAVEWTPEHIIGYVDGEEHFRSEDPSQLPPGPMGATIQLDWFPDEGPAGPGKMEVDWTRQYSL